MKNAMAEIDSSCRHGRFAEERKRYLGDLLNSGWKPNSVKGTAWRLKAFAARVDIRSKDGVTIEEITAAADSWMSEALHNFRTRPGPRRARRQFINDAKRWLRFLGLLRET